jgi:hypothetical protein
MPAPALIEFDSLLADATPDIAIAGRIRASMGLNFGTHFLAPGYVTWRKNDSVPLSLRQTAIEIMAFDAVIDNADRWQEKPNLLWKDDEMFVFDHEVAFAFTRLIGTTPPPFDDAGMSFLRNHPLYAGMRGQDIDLRRFIGELESWSDEEIAALCDGAPPEFGTMYLEKLRQWFTNARDRAQHLVDAIRRILRWKHPIHSPSFVISTTLFQGNSWMLVLPFMRQRLGFLALHVVAPMAAFQLSLEASRENISSGWCDISRLALKSLPSSYRQSCRWENFQLMWEAA